MIKTTKLLYFEHDLTGRLSFKAQAIRAVAQLVHLLPPGRSAYPHLRKITRLPYFPKTVTVVELAESIESYWRSDVHRATVEEVGRSAGIECVL